MNFYHFTILSLFATSVQGDKKDIPPNKWFQNSNLKLSWTNDGKPNDEEMAELTFFTFKLNLMQQGKQKDGRCEKIENRSSSLKKYVGKIASVRGNDFVYDHEIRGFEEVTDTETICEKIIDDYPFFSHHGIRPLKISSFLGQSEAVVTEIEYVNSKIVPKFYNVDAFQHPVLCCPCLCEEQQYFRRNSQANICKEGKFFVSSGILKKDKITGHDSIFIFKSAEGGEELTVAAHVI